MKFSSDKLIKVLCLSLGRGMAWETPHSRTRMDVCACAHTDPDKGAHRHMPS